MKPTNGRKPRTGEAKLMVEFRNGRTGEYTAGQLRWTHDDDGFPREWDVVAVRMAK